jgi:hypothetical protein
LFPIGTNFSIYNIQFRSLIYRQPPTEDWSNDIQQKKTYITY